MNQKNKKIRLGRLEFALLNQKLELFSFIQDVYTFICNHDPPTPANYSMS
jgi:hypothetical protein